METWLYDKTFEGFLTLVFECYQNKIFPDRILDQGNYQSFVFSNIHTIVTDETKAKRCWTGLEKKMSKTGCQMFYAVFLSELKDVELLMLEYVKKVFESKVNIETNFGDKTVLEMLKISKKVLREAERIRMFVRFQKTAEDTFYASFQPKYNVLPVALDHFEKRFADQKWVIYDTLRDFGYYYDLNSTQEIKMKDSKVDPLNGKINDSIVAEDEKQVQELWKNYFHFMCIKERINPKLHRQLLPKRFWKYLIEKQ